ncbi:MAG: YggT family protein [Anaerolineaceae bacterium]|nr:YggT family protein [Anaerolineaceae bacterium]
MDLILLFIRIFFRTAEILVFGHVLLSMFMPADRSLRIGIARIVDPILAPFRRFIKPINGIDFSPVVAIVAINLLEWLVSRLVISLF